MQSGTFCCEFGYGGTDRSAALRLQHSIRPHRMGCGGIRLTGTRCSPDVARLSAPTANSKAYVLFPTPVESDYDTFTCGHASNSISAALGMAVAAAKKGEKDRHVVAVIGDGSMSGGLAFEGLNNASSTANNLLIILNDNDMAIDRSVGGMKQYLFNLTTSNRYNQLRFKASKMLFKMGVLNEDRRKALIRFSNSLKSMAAQQQNIFEGMNIRYFGPINGHDVKTWHASCGI